jgi:hypothetical protein
MEGMYVMDGTNATISSPDMHAAEIMQGLIGEGLTGKLAKRRDAILGITCRHVTTNDMQIPENTIAMVM